MTPPADTAVVTPPKERLSLPFGGEMLTRGVVLTWLSVIVLIPLGAVVFRSDDGLELVEVAAEPRDLFRYVGSLGKHCLLADQIVRP